MKITENKWRCCLGREVVHSIEHQIDGSVKRKDARASHENSTENEKKAPNSLSGAIMYSFSLFPK